MEKQDLLNVLKRFENEDFIVKYGEKTVTVYDGKGEPLYWFHFRSDTDISFQLVFLQSDRIGILCYWVDDDFNEVLTILEQARKTLNTEGLQAFAHCLFAIGYDGGYETGYADGYDVGYYDNE